MKTQWTGWLMFKGNRLHLEQTYSSPEEALSALEALANTGREITHKRPDPSGKVIHVYGWGVYGIVQQVKYDCPIQTVYTTRDKFWPNDRFLVRFSMEWQDNQALDVMTLSEIIHMVDHFNKLEYPIDVYFTEYEYEEVNSAEEMLQNYAAWPVSDEWFLSFPFPLPVGRFINDDFFPE